MKAWLLLPCMAICAGALIPVQAAANASLSKSIGSVVYSALLLFVVGLLFISSYVLINRVPMPSIADFAKAPAYSYIGGLIVASYVLSITYLAPRMGVGNAICFIVTGQIVIAVLIDHFGVLGTPVTTIDFRRSAGVILMITGLFLARSS
ncbi:DMT family transporter [Dasania marina]|uniref:DMT family transporter n=1 Tax=Dasania marina TaxID=471499 RepID=UPI0030D9A1A0|tara:strand:- start:153432 stop:153881 length:450 start_codon:yes stop_codon:yes gene_type:complete